MKTIIKSLLIIIVIVNISCKKSNNTSIPPTQNVQSTQSTLSVCDLYQACFQDTFIYHPANTYSSTVDSMVIGAKIFYRFIGYGVPPVGTQLADSFIYKLEFVNIDLNVFTPTARLNVYGNKGGYATILSLRTKTNKQLQFEPMPF